MDYGEGGGVRGKLPEAREEEEEEKEKRFAGGAPADLFLELAAEFARGPEDG